MLFERIRVWVASETEGEVEVKSCRELVCLVCGAPVGRQIGALAQKIREGCTPGCVIRLIVVRRSHQHMIDLDVARYLEGSLRHVGSHGVSKQVNVLGVKVVEQELETVGWEPRCNLGGIGLVGPVPLFWFAGKVSGWPIETDKSDVGRDVSLDGLVSIKDLVGVVSETMHEHQHGFVGVAQ